MSDPLFAETRLARDGTERKSVVVVGLPRSGSSLLSQLMSELPGWYVFDDLYVARAARQAGVFDAPIEDRQLPGLLDFLGWQIRARKRHGLYAIPAVEEDEIDPMNAALAKVFAGQRPDWTELQEEWLVRLAARAGCPNWGYKMPGAFRHLDRLLATYPDMKAVFLMRAPEAVLASYKFMPETSQDGNPAQYHPISHAMYWRMAARAYRRAFERHGAERVTLLRFEDMIADPATALTGLAGFLGTPAPEAPALPEKQNTSFPGAKRRELTRLERGILSWATRADRDALGFPAPPPVPRFAAGDLADFLITSLRASSYRTHQALGAVRRRISPGGKV